MAGGQVLKHESIKTRMLIMAVAMMYFVMLVFQLFEQGVSLRSCKLLTRAYYSLLRWPTDQSPPIGLYYQKNKIVVFRNSRELGVFVKGRRPMYAESTAHIAEASEVILISKLLLLEISMEDISGMIPS